MEAYLMLFHLFNDVHKLRAKEGLRMGFFSKSRVCFILRFEVQILLCSLFYALLLWSTPRNAGDRFGLAYPHIHVPPGHCIMSLCSLGTDQKYSARRGELKFSPCIASHAFFLTDKRGHIFLISQRHCISWG